MSIICRLFKGGNQIDLKTPLSFPLLAEGVITGSIVWFEDYYEGIILYQGLKEGSVKGKRHKSSDPVTDEKIWRILDEDEQVVLSNKNPDNS